MATTPPPPSTLRMPPTPRLGAKYDQYELYSTRYSARLASQRTSRDRESRTTPPPSFPGSKTAKKHDINESATLSPPSSVQSSLRKQRSARSAGLFATHSLEDPSNTDDSDPFSGPEPSYIRHQPRSLRPTMTDGMLPTPAKTPRKKAVADVGSAARVLFPPPSSNKKTKKHMGFSLDSFSEDNTRGGSEIQIYTDSRDRIPEVDESEENPFYKKPMSSTTASRAPRRKESRRDKEIDDSIDREDGMVYVFRGKKMFRKFTEDLESDSDDDDDLGLLAARPDLIDSSIMDNVRPLTRSSIKPRVLFPTIEDRVPQETPLSDIDEEAATDIEDHLFHDEAEEVEEPAADVGMQQRLVTPPPHSTIDTPASPGATMRSLRSQTKREGPDHSDTPTAPESKKKRVSPFDGWLRRKQTPAVTGTKAKKRDADAAGSPGGPGGPAPKKPRGNKTTASV